jgi:tetratricopeptide (TPR) repeat protein
LARTLLAAAALVAVAVLAYWPALSGGFLWDDDAHVTRPDLRSLAGLGRIWSEVHATQQYYPVLHSLFWLEYRLWGDATVGYHLVNLALHLVAAALFGFLLKRLGVRGAWFGAGLFALHPVAVESVAWISEQKNTLSTVFYLAAALAYLRFDEGRERLWYGVASGLFVAALLSKSVTASLPAALLVLFWWRRGRLTARRDVLPLVPWFATAIAAGLFTSWVERGLGAHGEEYSWTLVQRCLLAGRALWFYAGKLLWPSDLTFVYPKFELDPTELTGYVYPFLAVGALLALWWFRKRSRAPLAATLLYVGTLFPALGFVNVYPFRYTFVADHFQYLASLAMFALAGAGLAKWSAPWRRWQRVGLACLMLGALSTLTALQSRMYRDAETLYRVTLERNPACWLASNNLGSLLQEQARTAEAIALFEDALRLRPDSAEIHVNLAGALRTGGKTERAIRHYREAIRLEPGVENAASNLANLLRSEGRKQEAVLLLQQALRLDPSSAEAENNLGAALADDGHWPEAIAHYLAAIELRPSFAEAENNLGVALAALGRPEEALAHYELALLARNDYAVAEANLGYALLDLRRPQEAIPHFERALTLDPEEARAAHGFGVALLTAGRPAEAVAPLERALRLRPDYTRAIVALAEALLQTDRSEDAISRLESWVGASPQAPEPLQMLATALARVGRCPDAIQRFEQGVRLQPDNPAAHFNLGLALLNCGRQREGLAKMQDVLRLEPSNARALSILGRG